MPLRPTMLAIAGTVIIEATIWSLYCCGIGDGSIVSAILLSVISPAVLLSLLRCQTLFGVLGSGTTRSGRTPADDAGGGTAGEGGKDAQFGEHDS